MSERNKNKNKDDKQDDKRPRASRSNKQVKDEVFVGEDACVMCNSYGDAGTRWLECERCTNWFCGSCLNMDENFFNILHMRKDFHWFCTECEGLAITAVKVDRDIEERCAAYMEKMSLRVTKLEEAVELKVDKTDTDAMGAHLTLLDSKVDGINTDIRDISARMDLMRFEHEEQEKRKNNVIIRGLPEEVESGDEALVLEVLTVSELVPA